MILPSEGDRIRVVTKGLLHHGYEGEVLSARGDYTRVLIEKKQELETVWFFTEDLKVIREYNT